MSQGWQVGTDGRFCGGCRYFYAIAFECRCDPPQVVVHDGQLLTVFPKRKHDEVACGEWTVLRTENQAGENAIIADLAREQRNERRRLSLLGGAK